MVTTAVKIEYPPELVAAIERLTPDMEYHITVEGAPAVMLALTNALVRFIRPEGDSVMVLLGYAKAAAELLRVGVALDTAMRGYEEFKSEITESNKRKGE